MNIAGIEANTLLSAQSASNRKPVQQEPAAVEQRSRANVQEVAKKQQAEAPQSQNAVTAIETNDAGRTAAPKTSLPKDAQADARSLLASASQAGASSPSRGSVVNAYA
ncbi:MAG: hypothetical protein P1V34_05895 [Alphaproteobacteria bacterium]|nr:hypothetical protein [Alphaproteobacteria bacterium]